MLESKGHDICTRNKESSLIYELLLPSSCKVIDLYVVEIHKSVVGVNKLF